MGEYTVSIVGELHCQKQIKSARIGEPVEFVPEPLNKFDSRAIKVTTCDGSALGYLERNGWLTRVILDDKTEVRASIRDITGGVRGKPSRGVILTVLTAHTVSKKRKGWFARLFS